MTLRQDSRCRTTLSIQRAINSSSARCLITRRPSAPSWGAILLDNGHINQAIELLRPDDFYIQAHRRVFQAMIALNERGSEINPILLADELRREGFFEQLGGMNFLTELTFGLPHLRTSRITLRSSATNLCFGG